MLGRLPSRRALRPPSRPEISRPTRPTTTPATRLDVVCVGNALVDVLASATDADLAELDLVKGTMVLVDHERSAAIYERDGRHHRGLRRIGGQHRGGRGRPGRPGRLPRPGGRRRPRTAFTHDIRSIGVAFDPTPTPAVPGEVVSGHCLVLVTEDAERTMATHLGVASEFGAVDLHDGHLASTQVVYLEGYLWEQPTAKAAMREAIEVAHRQRRGGGPDGVGPVLRPAPPVRVPRPADRRPRAALRQRGGGDDALRCRHLRRRSRRRGRDGRAGRA